MTTLTVTDCPVPVRMRILSESGRCLSARLLAWASGIRCDFSEGMLILSGTVASYRQKQLAQECTRRIAGVEQIVNRLKVVRDLPVE